jgi:hypothetical protein
MIGENFLSDTRVSSWTALRHFFDIDNGKVTVSRRRNSDINDCEPSKYCVMTASSLSMTRWCDCLALWRFSHPSLCSGPLPLAAAPSCASGARLSNHEGSHPLHFAKQKRTRKGSVFVWRRERDSNPRYRLTPYNALAGRRLQPLSHLS